MTSYDSALLNKLGKTHAICLTFGLALLTGCAGVPNFTSQPSVSQKVDAAGQQESINLYQLIDHLQCEIASAVHEINIKKSDSPTTRRTRTGKFVVSAQLSADVVQTTGLAPTLALIHPISAGSTDRSFLLGGEYSRANHSNITRYLKFNVDADSIKEFKQPETPSHPSGGPCSAGTGLGGNLDLEQSISLAWDDNFKLNLKDSKTTLGDEFLNSFVISIDFAVTRAVNGGPNWNLERVNGPDHAGSGLLSWKREAKDGLIIAFVDVPEPELQENEMSLSEADRATKLIGKRREAQQAAEHSADSALTRSLLLRAIPFR